MFVEIIEFLRCPAAHEEAQLIASAGRTAARHIIDGVLGCPVCNAEYPITGGVALFGEPAERALIEKPNAEAAMRVAAFLDLTDGTGYALLAGQWGSHVDVLSQMCTTPLLLLNPPRELRNTASGVIVTNGAVPLALGSGLAVALDASLSADQVRALVNVVRASGRVLGPVTMPVPDGVREIVRDQQDWVGEKIAGGTTHLVPLLRRA